MKVEYSDRITAKSYINRKTGCHFSLAFEKIIFPLIKGKKVLDIGPGDGRYLEFFNNFNNESVGVDVSIPNTLHMKKKGLNVISADLNEELPLEDKSFDVVFMSHVLEHLDSPINSLRDAHRILRENGILIVCVPVYKSLFSLLRRDHYFKKHSTHIYVFDISNVERLLLKTNFNLKKIVFNIPGLKRLKVGRVLGTFQLLPKIDFFARVFCDEIWFVSYKADYNWDNNAGKENGIAK